jgi:hypothetical protein
VFIFFGGQTSSDGYFFGTPDSLPEALNKPTSHCPMIGYFSNANANSRIKQQIDRQLLYPDSMYVTELSTSA